MLLYSYYTCFGVEPEDVLFMLDHNILHGSDDYTGERYVAVFFTDAAAFATGWKDEDWPFEQE